MRPIILAGASALALFAYPAVAAEDQTKTVAAEAAEDEAAAGLLVVTGSRIARSNLEATIPITSITAEQLLQSGNVSIGDRLALLPQFRPTFTNQNSGGAIGTAGLSILDLRGQGTARTLVLQSGIRHVSSQPGQQTVDVSTIPVDLIERVDIVTGGNSAVYGSDAVAGVVNFVMKRDFEGLQARAQAGISSEGDGRQYLATITAGKNFAGGRGNVAVSVEYSKNDPIFCTDRERLTGATNGFPGFQLVQDTTGEPAAGDGIIDNEFLTGLRRADFGLGGGLLTACNTAQAATNCSGVFNRAGTQLGAVYFFQPGGTLVRNQPTRDFRGVGSAQAQGGLGSTLIETGLLQIGNTRYAVNMIGSYEVSDAFRPYFEAKWVRTESLQEGQPTFTAATLPTTFQLSNPFLSAATRAQLVTLLPAGATSFSTSRFNTDFAGRGEDHSRELFRMVVGAQGNFMDSWNYSLALNYGRVETYYETRGNVNTARYGRAVNAVLNSAGQIVCAVNNDNTAANDDPACRPLNLFGSGAPSAEALAYIGQISSRRQWSEQYNAVGYIAGDLEKLFTLPGGPVKFVVGGEWRQERSFSQFDESTRRGDTFLNAIADFNPPRLDIWEAFGELRVPLLKDAPFFEELTLEGATRVSSYSSGRTGTVWSYNAGLVWSPMRDLRLRGNFARAVRAPTQFNLFAGRSQNFANIADPCGQQNINNNPNRVANCAAAGVPTTQTFTVNGQTTTEPFTNRPTSSVEGLSAGNPNLEAEKSNSFTVGGVYQPSYIPGLTLAVDWYRIDLRNAINTLAAQTVINQCYDDPGGINNQFCRAVFRNPNGTFAGQSNVQHGGGVLQFPVVGPGFLQAGFNYARQLTSGIDVDLNYNTKLGQDWRLGGRLILSYLLTRNIYTSVTEPSRLTRERSTTGNPEWNAQLNVNLGYKGFDLLYSFRYLGKMTIGAWATQNSEQGRPPTNLDAFPQVYYPEITYSDLRFSAKVIDGVSAYVGVDNVFDQMPPLGLLGTGTGSAIYTTTGRFFYGGVQLKF